MSIENILQNKTDTEKFEILARVEEKLRLDHNSKGVDFKQGKITREEWESYISDVFKPKSKKIGYLRSLQQEKEAVAKFGKADNLSKEQVNEITDLKKTKSKSTKFDSLIDINTI